MDIMDLKGLLESTVLQCRTRREVACGIENGLPEMEKQSETSDILLYEATIRERHARGRINCAKPIVRLLYALP